MGIKRMTKLQKLADRLRELSKAVRKELTLPGESNYKSGFDSGYKLGLAHGLEKAMNIALGRDPKQ